MTRNLVSSAAASRGWLVVQFQNLGCLADFAGSSLRALRQKILTRKVRRGFAKGAKKSSEKLKLHHYPWSPRTPALGCVFSNTIHATAMTTKQSTLPSGPTEPPLSQSAPRSDELSR